MALAVAREAGLIGRKRVLDSTALYDAVATQDTVTLIRPAIRALLRVVDKALGAELRSCCKRDDDYVAPGKPSCDWERHTGGAENKLGDRPAEMTESGVCGSKARAALPRTSSATARRNHGERGPGGSCSASLMAASRIRRGRL